MADPGEPIPLTPDVIRPRGTFPIHVNLPHPPRTADEALDQARFRLEDWEYAHRG